MPAVANLPGRSRCWHRMQPAWTRFRRGGAREFLVDLVAGGIEFPHVIPVHDIEIAVLTGSNREIPQAASRIFLIRQESSAGAEIGVTAVLLRLVVLFKVVNHSESA